MGERSVMRGTIKSKISGGQIEVSTEMGNVYSGKAHAPIPSNWGIGDEVDFNLGPQGSTGTLSNKGATIPWTVVNEEERRILDLNP